MILPSIIFTHSLLQKDRAKTSTIVSSLKQNHANRFGLSLGFAARLQKFFKSGRGLFIRFPEFFSFMQGRKEKNSWKQKSHHSIFQDPKGIGASLPRQWPLHSQSFTLRKMKKTRLSISSSLSLVATGLGTSSKVNGKRMTS